MSSYGHDAKPSSSEQKWTGNNYNNTNNNNTNNNTNNNNNNNNTNRKHNQLPRPDKNQKATGAIEELEKAVLHVGMTPDKTDQTVTKIYHHLSVNLDYGSDIVKGLKETKNFSLAAPQPRKFPENPELEPIYLEAMLKKLGLTGNRQKESLPCAPRPMHSRANRLPRGKEKLPEDRRVT